MVVIAAHGGAVPDTMLNTVISSIPPQAVTAADSLDHPGNYLLRDVIPRLRANDTTLIELNLAGRRIGDSGAQALAQVLEHNTCLTGLYLANNQIGSSGAQALANALVSYSALIRLDLHGNQIDEHGAQALASVLEHTTCLSELDLSANQIGDAGAQALAAALGLNRHLTGLCLSANQIGSNGARALAAALVSYSVLARLNLRDNQIDEHGVQALAAALEHTTCLSELYLSANQIGDAGAQALAAALAGTACLSRLRLTASQIGDSGAQALAAALRSNTCLRELWLDYNQIGARGVQALAVALASNQVLTSLNLGCNQIDTAGAQTLVAALEQNTCLTELWLFDEQISSDVFRTIQALQARNAMLSARPALPQAPIPQPVRLVVRQHTTAPAISMMNTVSSVSTSGQPALQANASPLRTEVRSQQMPGHVGIVQLGYDKARLRFSQPVEVLSAENKARAGFNDFLLAVRSLLSSQFAKSVRQPVCYLYYVKEIDVALLARIKQLEHDLLTLGMTVRNSDHGYVTTLADFVLLIGSPAWKAAAMDGHSDVNQYLALADARHLEIVPLLLSNCGASDEAKHNPCATVFTPEWLTEQIRDFRTPYQYYRQMANLRRPLGLIPYLYEIHYRKNKALYEAYEKLCKGEFLQCALTLSKP